MKKNMLKSLILFGLLSTSAGFAENTPWFPFHYTDSLFNTFQNQPDDFNQDRYESAMRVDLQYGLFSFSEQTALIMDVSFGTTMGQSTTSDLPFSINEISYRLGLFLEQQVGTRLWRFGFDHSCDHLVKKDGDEPWYIQDGVVRVDDNYYNRLYLGLGSQTLRRQVLRNADPEDTRFVWYTEAGYYVRDLGGLLDEDALYDGNDWQADLRADLKWRSYDAKAFSIYTTLDARMLFDTDSDSFVRLTPGLECLLKTGGYGVGFFAEYYILDEHPRDSREELVSLGIRGYF